MKSDVWVDRIATPPTSRILRISGRAGEGGADDGLTADDGLGSEDAELSTWPRVHAVIATWIVSTSATGRRRLGGGSSTVATSLRTRLMSSSQALEHEVAQASAAPD
jgi:hypothetical protein